MTAFIWPYDQPQLFPVHCEWLEAIRHAKNVSKLATGSLPIVWGRIGRFLLCNARDLALALMGRGGEGHAWGNRDGHAGQWQCNASSHIHPPLSMDALAKEPIRIWGWPMPSAPGTGRILRGRGDGGGKQATLSREGQSLSIDGTRQSGVGREKQKQTAPRAAAWPSFGGSLGQRKGLAKQGTDRQHSGGAWPSGPWRKGRISYG